MDFKPLAQAAQNRNGIRHRRRIDQHGLKAAFQCGVFLEILAVFIERCGPDAVQFPARQHGLEHIARICRSLGPARAHDGVNLVDEQ